jgi:hypothetical protein
LRFGGGGQLVFLALGRDVIDVDIDLVLFSPFLADFIKCLVSARHPVIPAPQSQGACGMDAAYIRCGDDRRGAEGGSLEYGTTR